MNEIRDLTKQEQTLLDEFQLTSAQREKVTEVWTELPPYKNKYFPYVLAFDLGIIISLLIMRFLPNPTFSSIVVYFIWIVYISIELLKLFVLFNFNHFDNEFYRKALDPIGTEKQRADYERLEETLFASTLKPDSMLWWAGKSKQTSYYDISMEMAKICLLLANGLVSLGIFLFFVGITSLYLSIHGKARTQKALDWIEKNDRISSLRPQKA